MSKKSSCSSRGRRNARHEVQVDIQIEQAVSPPEKFPHLKESLREQRPKVIYENPSAQHHFHLEYKLLPGVEQSCFKTDVVVYGGVVAKVFTDSDARVVRTWEENGKMWYGWTHKHTFAVTKETLLDIYRHNINFHVWNNKDRFSAKAKYDRPKAFRLPNEDRYTSLSDRAAGSVGNLQCPEGETSGSRRPRKLTGVLHSVKSKGKGKVAGKLRQKLNQSSESEGEGEYACVDLEVPDTLDEENGKDEAEGSAADTTQDKAAAVLPEMPPSAQSDGLASSMRKTAELDQQSLLEEEQIRQYGLVWLSLSWSDAFGKRPSATVRNSEGRRDLEGMVVTLELRTPLMPEEWQRELCPMSITLCSAYNMPSLPVPFQELRHRCKPAYAKFKFINQSVLQTCGQPQGDTICWNQTHVFLLGTVDPGILLEHLRGPPLLIEVHDRDCSDAVSQLVPSLFGEDEKDSILGTTAFTAGRVLQHNPFAGPQKPFSPFGVVRVDISSILSGQTFLEVTAPIQRGPRRSSQNQPMGCGSVPAGDYLGSGAVLKVRVELMYPVVVEDSTLVVGTRSTRKATNLLCPFIRCVYILSARTGHTVLKQLLDAVARINSATLCFDDLSQDIRAAALSTYKLTKSEMTDPALDVITGFHVADGEVHIVVLEGLGGQGMQTLWEEIPHHSLQDDGVITVLWNSSYQFSERLYGPLDVDIPCIRLHQPLHLLTRQSAVYIMGNVPEDSFKALMCLNELRHAYKLSDVVRCALLPSADMVTSLSMEFGVPASFADLALAEGPDQGLSLSEEDRERSSRTMPVKRQRRRRCASLDNHNPWYEEVLEERRGLTAKNFIRTNMQIISSLERPSGTQRPHSVAGETRGRQFLEEVSPPPPPLVGPSPSSASTPVFNYSSQKLNSTEQAKDRLRERLKQDGSHRYTYSQEYQSMTVVPVNVEKIAAQQEESRRGKWRTPEGFRYPGVPSSRQANAHPKKPPASRIADLKEPFTDNELHWNTVKPSVERVEVPWSEREQDFERYTKPPVDFGVTHPATIHHAGDSRKKELNEFLTEEQMKWEERLVVDDTRFHTMRKGSQAEQTTKGRKASSQLDKLQGLLKDEPQKHSLKAHSASAETPPLSTLHSFGLSGKKDSNIAGDKGVGYLPAGVIKGSLKLDRNVIPIASNN